MYGEQDPGLAGVRQNLRAKASHVSSGKEMRFGVRIQGRSPSSPFDGPDTVGNQRQLAEMLRLHKYWYSFLVLKTQDMDRN